MNNQFLTLGLNVEFSIDYFFHDAFYKTYSIRNDNELFQDYEIEGKAGL